MSGRALVIALGQSAAGDDGVGLAVLEELERRGLPRDIALVRARDATALIPLLETDGKIVLVDAAAGTTPGEVMALTADALADRGVRPLSSHGLDVGEIIALAQMLSPHRISPSIRIVAITIARPGHSGHGLTPRVAAAVGRAADRVLELVNGEWAASTE